MNGPSVGFGTCMWIINLLAVASIGFAMVGMDGLWRLMIGLQLLWVVYAIYWLWQSRRESDAEIYRMEQELILYMIEIDREFSPDRVTWDAQYRGIIRRDEDSDNGR